MTRIVFALAALGWVSYALTRRAVSRLLEHGPHSWGAR